MNLISKHNNLFKFKQSKLLPSKTLLLNSFKQFKTLNSFNTSKTYINPKTSNSSNTYFNSFAYLSKKYFCEKDKLKILKDELNNLTSTTKQLDSADKSEYSGFSEEVRIPVRIEDGITPKILSDLIGTKTYPYNDQIAIPLDKIVGCYDENDKLIGNKSLRDAYNFASDLKKDVVLRNDKTDVPIVKIIRYRIELIKRLVKKFTKNKDVVKGFIKESRSLFLNPNIAESDYQHKLEKASELLNKYLILRVAISIKDLNNKEEVTRANRILMNFSNELTHVGKIKVKPTPKKKKDNNGIYSIDNIDYLKSQEELDTEIKNAEDQLKPLKVEEREIDYNNLDIVYIEIESLVVDKSGIDYEKLLESISLDSLRTGVKQGSLDDLITGQEQFEIEISSDSDKEEQEDFNAKRLRENKEKLKKMEDNMKQLDKEMSKNKGNVTDLLHRKEEFLKSIEMEKKVIMAKEIRKDLINISLKLHEIQTLGASTIKQEKTETKRSKEKKEIEARDKKKGKGKKKK